MSVYCCGPKIRRVYDSIACDSREMSKLTRASSEVSVAGTCKMIFAFCNVVYWNTLTHGSLKQEPAPPVGGPEAPAVPTNGVSQCRIKSKAIANTRPVLRWRRRTSERR